MKNNLMSNLPDEVFGKTPTEYGFGAGANEVTPADELATEYADALCAMLQAKMHLQNAKARYLEMNYMSLRSIDDYCANEQEAFNRAADTLLFTLKKIK